MAIPNLLMPDWGNAGESIGNALMARTQRNRLAELLPGAMSGDETAQNRLLQVSPQHYLMAQNALRQRQTDTATAAKERTGQIRERLGLFGGTIANADEGQYPALYKSGRSEIIQEYPELAARLPEEWRPEFLPYAKALAGIKPQAAPGPTTDIQNYREAVNQGFNGSLLDYQTAVKRAGASNTSISYGAPVAGRDAQGNEVFFRPDNRGGTKIVEGVRPPPSSGSQPTQDERQSALLLQRLRRAQADISEVTDVAPDAERPEVIGATVGAIAGDTARNVANSSDRQMIESAQMDALDAALTLSTGAAYTKEQLEMQRRAHFPQIGDTEETARKKRERFAALVKDAELRAGRATPPDPNAPKPPPAVGTVKNGYVFNGGDPADRASWVKQ